MRSEVKKNSKQDRNWCWKRSRRVNSLKNSTCPFPNPLVANLVSASSRRGCPVLNSLDWLRLVIGLLTPLVARVKALTLRSNYRHRPLWTRSPDDDFPPSRTLERIRIITAWPSMKIEEYPILDITFSDASVYPSLKGVEVCSDLVIREQRGRDTPERLDMDKYLPRLKFSGRLLA